MSDKVVPLKAKKVSPSDSSSELNPNQEKGKLLPLLEEKRRIVPQYYRLDTLFIPLADRRFHLCSNPDCRGTASLKLVWYDKYLDKTVPGEAIVYSCGSKKCTRIAKSIAIRNCRK